MRSAAVGSLGVCLASNLGIDQSGSMNLLGKTALVFASAGGICK